HAGAHGLQGAVDRRALVGRAGREPHALRTRAPGSDRRDLAHSPGRLTVGSPAFLVENVFSSLIQFPGHALSTTDGNGLGASGFEVYHIENGRRSPTDRYQADAANPAPQLRVACDRVRYVTGLAPARAHNLAGAA